MNGSKVQKEGEDDVMVMLMRPNIFESKNFSPYRT